jgi:hypothetical protein
VSDWNDKEGRDSVEEKEREREKERKREREKEKERHLGKTFLGK